MALGSELAVLVGLTLLNAVFSGAEIAVISVRPSRLRELVDEGRSAASAVLALRKQPEQFLATVQVGITVVGASAAAFGGSVMTAPIAGALRGLGAGDWADTAAFVSVVSLVSFLSIVFGELVPKSIALRASERYALLVGPALLGLSRVARPIVWLLTAASNLVLRPLHDRTTFIEARMSAEELRQMVEDVSNAGALDARAGEIASRAIELGELRAAAVMVPRHTIVWIPAEATTEQIRRILREHPHSRYPVARDGENDVLGYVLARDVYEQLIAGALDLSAAIRKLPFFPERMSAVELLGQLQAARSKIGLVVDDYGAVSGLVSVKDIAEELLGEVLTEYDRPESNIVAEGDDSFVVRGTTPVHQLNRELDLDLPTGPEWSTLAGLVMAVAGKIPERNERITLPDGIEVEILDATARGVRLLRVRKPRPSQVEAET